MVDTLPGTLRTDIAGDVQRWHDFYLLISLEFCSIEHVVSMAAQTLCAVLQAEACVVAHVAAGGERVEGRQGKLPGKFTALALQAEQRLMQGMVTPMTQAVGECTCVSLPITAGSSCIGVIHVIAPRAPYDLAELQFVAVLLGNTLRRQIVAEQSANKERRRLEQGLAAQYAVTSVLAEASTLNDALPRLLGTIGERFHWDVGVAWLVDHDAHVLRCGEVWHSPAINSASILDACMATTFETGAGLPGRVWATGEPVSVPNLQRDPSFPRVLIAAGLNGAFGIPILNGREVVGVLEYFSRGVLQPNADVLASLSTISGQIGQFMERKRVEAALREADHQFRTTFDQAAVGIAHVSMDGCWLRVNQHLCDIVGYTQAELLARTFQDITHPDDLEHDLDQVNRLLKNDIRNYVIEKRYIRKDGTPVWVELTVAVAHSTHGAPNYFISVVVPINHRKRIEAENARLLSELRTERDRLVRREVEVRAQIGRDLHDGPVQQVAVATIAVQHARRVAQREPERLDETLHDLQEQLKRVTHDLRNVLYELRPLGIAEDGLEGVLRQYVERFRDPSGLQIHLDVPGGLRRMDVDRESAAFIIVQEAVNNARKHAQARDIWITVREQDDALDVEVRDNGRGFDLQATQANYIKRGSFGLLNMCERAQLIGGTCDMWSAPGAGTRIAVSVPFLDRNHKGPDGALCF
jgi:PAS domain S-box-containing protein